MVWFLGLVGAIGFCGFGLKPLLLKMAGSEASQHLQLRTSKRKRKGKKPYSPDSSCSSSPTNSSEEENPSDNVNINKKNKSKKKKAPKKIADPPAIDFSFDSSPLASPCTSNSRPPLVSTTEMSHSLNYNHLPKSTGQNQIKANSFQQQSSSDIGTYTQVQQYFAEIRGQLKMMNLSIAKIFEILNERHVEVNLQNPKVIDMLPLKNDEDIEEMEQLLSYPKNVNVVKIHLKNLGGDTSAILVGNMLRTLSLRLCDTYTWYGTSEKNTFQDLKLRYAIVDAIQLANSNYRFSDIKKVTQNWFRNANSKLKELIDADKENQNRAHDKRKRKKQKNPQED